MGQGQRGGMRLGAEAGGMWAHESRRPVHAWNLEKQGNNPPLQPQEKHSPIHPFLGFRLPELYETAFALLKPLSLWSSIIAATGKQSRCSWGIRQG